MIRCLLCTRPAEPVMKTRLLVCALIVLAVAVGGCRKSANEPPVATPSLTVSQTRVPLGSPLELTYEFKIAADAPAFRENYRVFVHFVDADEELMWTCLLYTSPSP